MAGRVAVAGEELFVSTDISLWRATLEVYSKVIEQKEEGRSQKSKRTGESLVELDNWYELFQFPPTTQPFLLAGTSRHCQE